MTRLTIDGAGTVRLIDDDGAVLDTVILGDDGRSTHADVETGYMRRLVTEWVADDPEPEYSDLDRMDIYVSASDVADDEGRARLLAMLVVMGLGVMIFGAMTLVALFLLWLVFP